MEYRHAGAQPLTPDEWRDAALVVVLGGPLGAGDLAAYPWLATEIDGLRQRLALGRPTLGICLGAQLMAVALGGRIERRGADNVPAMEIGWAPLDTVADAGPLGALQGIPVLHWHGDNIVPPPGIVSLAATPGTPCQAFAAGHHALGLQFHAEFAAHALEEWLAGHAVELARAGTDLAALRRDTSRHGDTLAQAGQALLRGWLAGLPAAHAR
ncbi:glutamine amidotransferase-related protein [Pseudoduganella lutea]|uniref:glutamine amidotransferase-related protein n=1 Tax=Pseudoduganella lutea TaxID=321985 RepID=UPI001E49676D|nr:gamma-glutamyl-gamma-aminobutyrate hydrolase family protein [Pseudoduganella lutea]